ncbi:hypothetical protein D5S17_35975 [Pseudonocardiaceae bacterium YIM PH 21723]|nr:hypothetical protein D5S17_35975 [Pseudonocardiaceae bacterium YIM PH 21723]
MLMDLSTPVSPERQVEVRHRVGLISACLAVAEAVATADALVQPEAVNKFYGQELGALVSVHDPTTEHGAAILDGIYEGLLVLTHSGVQLMGITTEGKWDPAGTQQAAQIAALREVMSAESHELVQAARRYPAPEDYLDYQQRQEGTFATAYSAAGTVTRALLQRERMPIPQGARWQLLAQHMFCVLGSPVAAGW